MKNRDHFSDILYIYSDLSFLIEYLNKPKGFMNYLHLRVVLKIVTQYKRFFKGTLHFLKYFFAVGRIIFIYELPKLIDSIVFS